MKKIIPLILVMLFAFSMASCKNNDESKETLSKNVSSEINEQVEKQNTGLLSSSSSITPTTASGGMYLYISGKTQGTINGECSESGDKRNSIELADFSEGITVPVDEESGLPMGKREFEAVTFVHKLDCSSPSLRRALSTGEYLDITVDFYRLKNDGTQEKYFSIMYKNALLVSIEIFTKERSTHYEEVSFTYSSVEYLFCNGNTSFSDSRR